ncbi:MAG TPA: thioredoxin domain-containing protein [Terriglobia bacterium]|nr:thioredoxin domain-containing protein [Terriglobia bacterium]
MSTLKVSVGPEDHTQGDAQAGCTLVEYGDYECPHCGHAYPIVKRLQKVFGKRLRFVFRNFPLNEMHPHAESAAESAEFAGAHGKFWEMHDLLFENQERLGDALFQELAKILKLNQADLREALEKREYIARVRADFTGGVRSGVNGTPTFFINGQRHDGPFEFEDLVGAIERALTSA